MKELSREVPTTEEWKIIFKRLHINPQKSRILIGEKPVFVGTKEKEKLDMLKTLFEDFGVLGVRVECEEGFFLVSAGMMRGREGREEVKKGEEKKKGERNEEGDKRPR
jgi:hypothetical protein